MIMTIDGPVASGKSTVARAVARYCNCYYINSGLMFRVYAYLLVTDCALDPGQLESVSDERVNSCVDGYALEYLYRDGHEIITYCDRDLTPLLKNARVDQWASRASASPAIRKIMMVWERKLARNHDVIVDGRDTGSVIFPDAHVKVFLTASLDERMSRWQMDQKARGTILSDAQARAQIIERDERDRTRAFAPLRVPEGAITIDSTNVPIDEVVNKIVALCQNARSSKNGKIF